MDLKLKKRELKIDVYGESNEVLRFPTVIEHNTYLKSLFEEGADEYQETVKFLNSLGMKKEVVKELELPDMQEIIGLLTSKKKD